MADAQLTSADEVGDTRRHHAVIAGTGRSGTSFLVQFLGACGLDTNLDAEDEAYFDRARAGLEHSLVARDDLPYVVKDPWLFAYCEAVDLETVAIDALILPMRDLADAATSRLLQERIGLLVSQPNRPAPEVYCLTPGGALQSLDPVDQARLLAVGFHDLLGWAVREGIPVYLLDFPRLVEDGEYLISTLWPWLETHCDEEQARAAFTQTADPSRIRIKAETEATAAAQDGSRAAAVAELDRTALLALIDEHFDAAAAIRQELWDTSLQLTNTESLVEGVRKERWEAQLQAENSARHAERLRQDLWKSQLQVANLQARADDSRQRLAQVSDDLVKATLMLEARDRALADVRGRLVRTQERLADTRRRLRLNRKRLQATRADLADSQAKVRAIYATTGWKLAKPLRLLGDRPRYETRGHADADADAPPGTGPSAEQR